MFLLRLLLFFILLYSFPENPDFIAVEIIREVKKGQELKDEQIETIFEKNKDKIINELKKKFSIEENPIVNEKKEKDLNIFDLFNIDTNHENKSKLVDSTSSKPKDNPTGDNKEYFNIPVDKFLFNSFIKNLSLLNNINKQSIEPIKGISAYKNTNSNKILDFWGKIEFQDKSGKIQDSSGLLEGVIKKDIAEIVQTSNLDKTGFFIDKHLSESEKINNLKNMRKIVKEMTKTKNLPVTQFIEKKLTLGLKNDILMYNFYPLKEEDIIYVCVCKNNNCNGECEEIRTVERKNLM